MGTLYDLLGALPSDDAEGLRAAFRKAAKATHPDTNPNDPNASLRFRELVRAYDILNDAEQRSTYDELLAIALLPPPVKSTRVYETIGKLASCTIAATVISGALVGGYMLFADVAKTQDRVAMASDAMAPQPAEIVAVEPAPQPDLAAVRDVLRDAQAATGMSDGMVMAAAIVPAMSKDGESAIGSAGANAGPANTSLANNPATNHAKSYRERGVFAYRDGDIYRALADFDLAIQHDPGFAEAYLNRGIVLYQMRQFNRAFADMDKARRILSSKRTKTALRAPRKTPPVTVRPVQKDQIQQKSPIQVSAAVTP
jgi:curved DNA-binding protein CbpA